MLRLKGGDVVKPNVTIEGALIQKERCRRVPKIKIKINVFGFNEKKIRMRMD